MRYDYAAQAKEEVPACPVCGTANPSVPVYDRYGFLLGLSECACSFSYLNPRLTTEAYAEFYQHWYRSLAAALFRHPPSQARRDLVSETYGRELARRWPDLHADWLLDAGGSTGALVAGWVSAQANPVNVTVLDPNADELARAQARGFRTVCGSAEHVNESLGTVAGVLCLQTVDHFCAPITALTNLWRVTRPGGWLILDYVRLVQQLLLQPQGQGFVVMVEPKRAVKLDHPCYWTEASIKMALERAGWTVEQHKRAGVKGLVRCRKMS